MNLLGEMRASQQAAMQYMSSAHGKGIVGLSWNSENNTEFTARELATNQDLPVACKRVE